jgi:hypothetical protein
VSQPDYWYDAPLVNGPYMYSKGHTGYLTIDDPRDYCHPLITGNRHRRNASGLKRCSKAAKDARSGGVNRTFFAPN